MKGKSLVAVALLLSGTASVTFAQALTNAQNTWSPGAPMQTAVERTSAAVLENQIYVVGGGTITEAVANTQIYNPATNTWSTGVPLPIATSGGCAEVVNNILYYIGGNTGTPGNAQYTDAVWAFNPETQAWSPEAPMPTPRASLRCVADRNVIYAAGGYNGSFLTTVEGYNTATNEWANEPSLPIAESVFAAGLIGTTFVVTDGSNGAANGDTYGFNVTKGWTQLQSDPTVRQDTCAAVIGPRLYSASGWDGNQQNQTGLTITESFRPSQDAWNTNLAPIPQVTIDAGSVAYGGRLYCFGGVTNNNLLNNVQIYQP